MVNMNPRHEELDRRCKISLQQNNMAFADAANAGVTIDGDRRAYHMVSRSGRTDDQINHVCGFVFDANVPSLLWRMALLIRIPGSLVHSTMHAATTVHPSQHNPEVTSKSYAASVGTDVFRTMTPRKESGYQQG